LKISILQENLAQGVSTAARSASTKASLPILSHLLLSTDQGRLKISATNLEIGVNVWVGAKVTKEGSIAVPARILQELVQSLPPGKLELDATDGGLHLSSGSAEANLAGIAGTEFPAIPKFPKTGAVSFPAEQLAAAIEEVAYAAAAEEGRPTLTAVLWRVKGKGVELVATDGYRLAKKEITLPDKVNDFQALVPARALLEVARIITDNRSRGEPIDDVNVSLDSGENQISFSLGSVEMTSRLVAGDYPAFENILPQDFSVRGIFAKDELLLAIRQAAVFARDIGSIIKLKLDREGVELSANTAQVGDEKTRIPGTVEGGTVTIAFNSRYLIDALTHLNKSQVSFETKSNLSPGVLRAIGDETVTTLVMPVRLQQ
jgi:DNA polymerase-3 subunit beta